MNIKSIGNQLINNNKIVASIWFGLVVLALVNAYNSHAYNNFLIFRQSFFHLQNETNLYLEYVTQYWDHYYYSPSFAALVVPFTLLPVAFSMFAWGIFDAGISANPFSI